MKNFKLIVAGSRTFSNRELLVAELNKLADGELKPYIVDLVSGMADGADRMAWDFARKEGVVCHEFPAIWHVNNNLDRSAGYKRNLKMADFSDGLLAFWDGTSKGTKHMIDIMEKAGKPVRTIHYVSLVPGISVPINDER